jgi:hypothetical protein
MFRLDGWPNDCDGLPSSCHKVPSTPFQKTYAVPLAG